MAILLKVGRVNPIGRQKEVNKRILGVNDLSYFLNSPVHSFYYQSHTYKSIFEIVCGRSKVIDHKRSYCTNLFLSLLSLLYVESKFEPLNVKICAEKCLQ